MIWRSLAVWLIVLVGMPASHELVIAQPEKLDPEHARQMAEGRELFRTEVRTILSGRCLKCHGGEKTEGEFDLTTREGILKGGASGRAVELRSASTSHLMRLIRHEDEPVMPEDGVRLDQRQIDAIAKWINLGAPYDKPLQAAGNVDPLAWTQRTIDDSAREFWSFQPLRPVEPPVIPDETWVQTDIDRFILAELIENGLRPNDLASRVNAKSLFRLDRITSHARRGQSVPQRPVPRRV